MKKINWKKEISTIIGFTLIMFFATIVVAQSILADQRKWHTGARILDGQASQIIEYNETLSTVNYSRACATVTNNSSDEVFVPTKIVTEWNAFDGNLPQNVSTYFCPLNGVCGPANGTTVTSYPTVLDDLCTDGLEAIVDAVGTDGTFNWTCDGEYLGTDATCSANRQYNGICGGSDGGTFATAPTSDLCDLGSNTAVTGGSGSPFNWTCQGANGGSNTACSASFQSTGPYTLGAWSACSTTCGTGTQTRSVTCDFNTCTGESNSSQSCEAGSTTCGWTGYGSYGACSTSCGSGSQYRTRTCTTGAPGSAHCAGSDTQATSCSAGSSTCGWGAFGSWGACSNSCGSGTQYRYRSCNVAGYCAGSSSDSQSCSSTSGCAGCTLYRPYAWPTQSGGTDSCLESNSGTTAMSHGQTINTSSTQCAGGGNYNCQGQAAITCTNGVKSYNNISCARSGGQVN